MDILSPDLLWVDKRCYRLPILTSGNLGSEYRNIEEEWMENAENTTYGPGEDVQDFDENNEKDEVELLIKTITEGVYELKIPIPQTFWSQIIGSKGITKKRIESNTKTRIYIPRPMEHGDIQIKGSSINEIILAKKCIDEIVLSARQKLTFTHFISLPTNSEEIKMNFIKFKEEVIKKFGSDRGVDESIFQNPNKLHLTIATLVLADQRERKVAEERLYEIYNKAIKPMLEGLHNQKLKLEMRGIEYMNDDPGEVDVLYGRLHSTQDINLLQNIANCILNYFTEHKLIKKNEGQNVKIHVTLMNTLFREEEMEELNQEINPLNKIRRGRRQRSTFNAVNILQKFQDYYFGQQDFKTIELSMRFSTGKNGYYKSSSAVNL